MNIDKDVVIEIQKRISNAEREHSATVIFAIESGSRAWGFGSPNSDYDVRFVYINQLKWYLSIDLEMRRDVIEYKIIDDIDINGWDLRKALRLYGKSNPGIIEWLQSPLIYRDDGKLKNILLNNLSDIYSCSSGLNHYLSMAKNNYRSYLQTEIVPIKKYFYVLRPLLACEYIIKFQKAPPIEFDILLNAGDLENDLVDEIQVLLAKKKSVVEMSMEPAVEIINRYIEKKFEQYDKYLSGENPESHSNKLEILNDIFRSYLNL